MGRVKERMRNRAREQEVDVSDGAGGSGVWKIRSVVTNYQGLELLLSWLLN